MANKTVCIEREYGSNGKKIAGWLSKKTGIECYDKAALKEVAEKNGLVLDSMEEGIEKERKIYSEAIKFLAEKRSCIFIGTCASSVLQGRPRNMNVFIKADMNSRIRWAMDSENVDEDRAREMISEKDEKRREYRKNYAIAETGEPVEYDLIISSSKFGMEGTTEMIRSCMSRI